jgi:hypothetical protein
MNKVRVKIQPHGYNNKKVPPPHFFQLWAGLMSCFFLCFFFSFRAFIFSPKNILNKSAHFLPMNARLLSYLPPLSSQLIS